MEKIISFEKGSLCYTIAGQGSAVVFLHGFLEDHHIWNSFAEQISKKHTVITIDLPGFGKSSLFNEINSMAFMANAVLYLLNEENIDNCVMVGHSMGGYVTMAFAGLYPDRLKGIVLFHSHAQADSEEAKVNRDRTIKLVRHDKLGFINSFVPLMFAEKNKNKFEEEIVNLRKNAEILSPDAVIAALAGMRDRDDQSALMRELEIPVLFIIGKQDSRITSEIIMPQLSLPANCEAVILDGVGHMGFIEAPGLTYSAVEHFVERNM